MNLGLSSTWRETKVVASHRLLAGAGEAAVHRRVWAQLCLLRRPVDAPGCLDPPKNWRQSFWLPSEPTQNMGHKHQVSWWKPKTACFSGFPLEQAFGGRTKGLHQLVEHPSIHWASSIPTRGVGPSAVREMGGVLLHRRLPCWTNP